MNTLEFKSRVEFLRKWYSRLDVQYAMCKFTYNREFAFLNPKFLSVENPSLGFSDRFFRIHSPQHFQEVLFYGRRFMNYQNIQNEVTNDYVFNCYHSLASYQKGNIYRNLSRSEEDKNNVEQWKLNSYKEISDYDLLIDIDGNYNHDDLRMAHYSAKMIWELLSGNDISFECRFSGSGFHFLIPLKPNKSMNSHDDINFYSQLNQFNRLLHDKFSQMVDIIMRMHDKSLVKLPYSIVNYPKAVFTAFNFMSFQEFIDFNKNMSLPCYWDNVRNRQKVIFGHQFNNTENFINLFNILENREQIKDLRV